MSFFDKLAIIYELEKRGWRNVGGYTMVPPDSLWEGRPKSFYVYTAQRLHNILSPSDTVRVDEDEDGVE